MTPNLAGVLAAVVRGRIVRLSLDDEQKRAFRDGDGQLALSVVRHLLGARRASAQSGRLPERFPLTEAAFQAIARKLGRQVGIKRSRRLLRRLTTAGIIKDSGSYRQKYRNAASSGGYRVTLYRLAVGTAGVVRRGVRFAAASSLKPPVGRAGAVKPDSRPRWWQHALFGEPDGLPPPTLSPLQRRRWRSAEERGRLPLRPARKNSR